MGTAQVPVYKYSELSEKAQEKAREEYLQDGIGYDWWSLLYEDFAHAADILGIDLRQHVVKLMGGGTRNEPAIYFSGFWSQGDGACFEGDYAYAKGSTTKIREYAPEDKALHAIADNLYKIQRRYFYQLTASVLLKNSHYYHERSTEIRVYWQADDYRDIGTAEEEIAEELRNYMRYMYRRLEKEYEWLTSDEQVAETLETNEYEYTEDGAM